MASEDEEDGDELEMIGEDRIRQTGEDDEDLLKPDKDLQDSPETPYKVGKEPHESRILDQTSR